MVAIAPGAALCGVGPAVQYQACFCAENYSCSWESQQKLQPPELHFLTPICTKSFVGWGLQRSPDSLAVFRGPEGGEGREGENRGSGEEERGGVCPLP